MALASELSLPIQPLVRCGILLPLDPFADRRNLGQHLTVGSVVSLGHDCGCQCVLVGCLDDGDPMRTQQPAELVSRTRTAATVRPHLIDVAGARSAIWS